MTYQEKFELLRDEFVKTSDLYIKADKELSSINGFFDISLIENFTTAKRDFEIAGNNYHNFLVIAKNNNARPTDELISI